MFIGFVCARTCVCVCPRAPVLCVSIVYICLLLSDIGPSRPLDRSGFRRVVLERLASWGFLDIGINKKRGKKTQVPLFSRPLSLLTLLLLLHPLSPPPYSSTVQLHVSRQKSKNLSERRRQRRRTAFITKMDWRRSSYKVVCYIYNIYIYKR